MDEDRKIRFLIPPILLVASLLWAALLDESVRNCIVEALKSHDDWSKSIGLVVGVIAGGGIVMLAAGYIIGTMTYCCLRLLFRYLLFPCGPRRWRECLFHEAAMSRGTFERVRQMLGAPGEPPYDRQQELSVGAAFDYDVLLKNHKGIHQWMFRRWNGFNTAANSVLALILSFPLGYALRLAQPWWCGSVAVFAAILLGIAYWAWHDTMNMLDFMVILPPSKERRRE